MKKILSIMLLISITTLLSCNSGDKKTESTSKDSSTTAAKESTGTTNTTSTSPDTTSGTAPGNTEAALIDPLLAFKLTRNQLIQVETNHPNVKKLLFQTGFLNIEEPSTMKLYMYHIENHKDYGRGQTPIALGYDVIGPPAYNLGNDMTFGNYEIKWKVLTDELKTGSNWNPFSHLRFTPKIKTVNGINFLSFTIELVTVEPGTGVIKVKKIKNLPPDTNPSPPAKPDPDA